MIIAGMIIAGMIIAGMIIAGMIIEGLVITLRIGFFLPGRTNFFLARTLLMNIGQAKIVSRNSPHRGFGCLEMTGWPAFAREPLCKPGQYH